MFVQRVIMGVQVRICSLLFAVVGGGVVIVVLSERKAVDAGALILFRLSIVGLLHVRYHIPISNLVTKCTKMTLFDWEVVWRGLASWPMANLESLPYYHRCLAVMLPSTSVV